MINKFKGRRVLIFGLGLNQGGVGSAKFFAKKGAQVRITDLKNEEALKPSLKQLKEFKDITYTLGEHKYEDLEWADLIIKNPGVKPGNPFIKHAERNGKQIETDMGIFLQAVKPDQIIGVTGTKGKSTTASLIYEVLKNTKKDVVLAGNIGISVLDSLPYIKEDTLVVLEISSFQLEAFDAHKASPKWAIITNITPDHLNYYINIEEYIAAKKIIGKYQKETDFLFIKKSDPVVDQSNFLAGIKAKIIKYSKNDLPANFHPKLLGEHNLENISAALSVGKTFGISEDSVLQTLSTFPGVPFRMELIKNWQGVKIYNDTAATSPEAGIKAIETFPNCILICGGMNKKMDYTKYATIVGNNVKKAFFLAGDSTDSILESLRAKRSNLLIYGPYNDLEKLLTDIKAAVNPGDIILFSPAATSFNLFQNEFDRGRKFNESVQKIFDND